MNGSFVIGLIAGFLLVGIEAASQKCSGYPSGHTMCLTARGKVLPLSAFEKRAILNKHNQLRAAVFPPAKDMQKLYWDDELAAIAAKWAAQCSMGHDKNTARRAKSMPGVTVGQNMAYGQANFIKAIEAWHSEVKDFSYGKGSKNGGKIGHYTQVVLATASKVGCAKVDCTGKLSYKSVYTCNYVTGQTPTQQKQPYCTGSSCKTCSSKSGKLCDCRGKVCLNGGTFDIATCSCKCYSLYGGDHCQIKKCPAKNTDPSLCSHPNYKGACEKYSNWGPQYCPFTCGLCP